MNIITPEIIFKRLASRLKKRWDDLDCIIHAESGFEKWVQWELFLCFKNKLFPVVYKKNGHFLRENEKNDGERIADIRLEYSYDRENGNEERADLFIAQTPYIINEIDLETWKVKTSSEKGLREKYETRECHYVELKTDWWDLNKDPEDSKDPENQKKDAPSGLMKDIEKKINGTGSIKPAWKPCSLIAISVVTFFNSEKRNDTFGKREIIKKISGLIEGNKIPKLNWLYSHIENNTYLIGAYRLLP